MDKYVERGELREQSLENREQSTEYREQRTENREQLPCGLFLAPAYHFRYL